MPAPMSDPAAPGSEGDFGFLSFFVLSASDAPSRFMGSFVCPHLQHGFKRVYYHDLHDLDPA